MYMIVLISYQSYTIVWWGDSYKTPMEGLTSILNSLDDTHVGPTVIFHAFSVSEACGNITTDPDGSVESDGINF